MYKFNEISISVLIVFIILLIFEIYLSHDKEDPIIYLKKLDKNSDGVITRKELKEILIEHSEYSNNDNNSLEKISIDALSGAVKGMIMGSLINGIDGAITGGIVMSILSPLINIAEKKII